MHVYVFVCFRFTAIISAGLAQSVERQALNLMVEGSSPSFGVLFLVLFYFHGNMVESFSST